MSNPSNDVTARIKNEALSIRECKFALIFANEFATYSRRDGAKLQRRAQHAIVARRGTVRALHLVKAFQDGKQFLDQERYGYGSDAGKHPGMRVEQHHATSTAMFMLDKAGASREVIDDFIEWCNMSMRENA